MAVTRPSPRTLIGAHWRRLLALGLALCAAVRPAWAMDLSEYQIKAGFVYNFAVLSSWPAEVGDTLRLCLYGHDGFGADIDALNKKAVGTRTLVVERRTEVESLRSCQIVFIPVAEAARVTRVLAAVQGWPVLTIAENPGAAHAGAMLNLGMAQGRITFEVNQGAARRAGLGLSAKLLRLATEVLP